MTVAERRAEEAVAAYSGFSISVMFYGERAQTSSGFKGVLAEEEGEEDLSANEALAGA